MKFFFAVLIISLGLISCREEEPNSFIIWTDRPEFAFYTEFFNASQNRYNAEVRYFPSPAVQLSQSAEPPDLVISSWLTSSAVSGQFRALDDFFDLRGLDQTSFYPQLLSLGFIDGRQLLLPVSFNLPSIVFPSSHGNVSSNPFIIDLEEIKTGSKAFDTRANNAYTRIGFSPLSNGEFLYLTASLYGAGFMEGTPLAWNSSMLDEAVSWLTFWFNDENENLQGNIQMEDDFAFRYFFDPPDRLINSGRILFTYMDSSDFFTFPEDRRINLSFRWIGANDMIPLIDGGVFFGIHRRTQANRAVEAFTLWFFSMETQRELLEVSRELRLDEIYFGIAGGFSALRTVTEQIFPQFYPALIGHLPPGNFFSPPNILPRGWASIRERVIIPYIQDQIRNETGQVRSLENRISEWYRLNRD